MQQSSLDIASSSISNKENADRPKFRKLLSKSDLSSAAPPVFLKQRAVLAPRQDLLQQQPTPYLAPSIHSKFQLKSSSSSSDGKYLAPSIHVASSAASAPLHNSAGMMQKPTKASNLSFSLDLNPSSSTAAVRKPMALLQPQTMPTSTIPAAAATRTTTTTTTLKRELPLPVPQPPSTTSSQEPQLPPVKLVKPYESPVKPPQPPMAVAVVVVEPIPAPAPPPPPQEDARAALQRRRQEEARRKGEDMVKRARALETEGKTAAALAVYKESLYLFPENDKLAAKVEKLKTKLVEERNGGSSNFNNNNTSFSQDVEEDALEAMFAAPQQQQQHEQTTTAPAKPAASSRRRSMSVAAAAESEEEAEGEESSAAADLVRRYGKHNPASLQLCAFVFKYMEVAEVQQACFGEEEEEESRCVVRFNPYDCAVMPPATRANSDEELDSQLFPVDQTVHILAQCCRLVDDFKKQQASSSASAAVANEFLLHAAAPSFLACTLAHSLAVPCTCSSSGRCRQFGAVPVKARLGQMLSTAMRCVLRRLFNDDEGGLALVANSGSYRFANDDVAAVVHQALLLVSTKQALVENLVLLRGGRAGASSSSSVEDDIGSIGEYAQAHQFLCDLLPTEAACSALAGKDTAAWAKLRKYLAVAREFRLQDELVLAPLADLHDLLGKLKQQQPLVKACRAHVDFAFRAATREDKCGQCTCEGARRRRANAMGMWMAPSLCKTSATTAASTSAAPLETCSLCAQAVVGAVGGISCECCEKHFHVHCLGLPLGYDSDFVCGKCVPKFLHY